MRYNILIAEDDPDLIDMLALYIDRQDFSIIRAMDGEEALEQFRNTKIDLALVDIMMPKMNGIELIRLIRKESNIPIIVLSAKSADTDKVMGLNIGADAYVTKYKNAAL